MDGQPEKETEKETEEETEEETETPPEPYPLWRSMEWTPVQLIFAIRGLILLTIACALIAVCLVFWQSASLAAILIAPMGITLLCWGVGRLNHVFWYSYQHDPALDGEPLRKVTSLCDFVLLERYAPPWTLVAQVAGAITVAFLAPPSWRDPTTWRDLIVWAVPWLMVIPVLCGTVANFVSFVAATTIIEWAPQRDPEANPLAAPARGIRLLLRWLVMRVNGVGLALVTIPFGFIGYNIMLVPFGESAPLARYAVYFGWFAAFFMVLALSEFTSPLPTTASFATGEQ